MSSNSLDDRLYEIPPGCTELALKEICLALKFEVTRLEGSSLAEKYFSLASQLGAQNR